MWKKNNFESGQQKSTHITLRYKIQNQVEILFHRMVPKKSCRIREIVYPILKLQYDGDSRNRQDVSFEFQ